MKLDRDKMETNKIIKISIKNYSHEEKEAIISLLNKMEINYTEEYITKTIYFEYIKVDGN